LRSGCESPASAPVPMAAADPAPVCRSLNEHGCRYVLIGGHAVGVHGYPRATRDTDLLLGPGEDNWGRALTALKSLGALHPDGRALDPASDRPRAHLRVDSPAGPVDLLEEGASPLNFDEVRAHALVVVLDDVEIPVCGLAELVAFKRLAGRTQDAADLEELGRAHGDLPHLPVPGLDTD